MRTLDSTPDSVPDYYIAADAPLKRLYWLWPGRIPMGRLTLLVGDPGLGKTLLAADLAARVSANVPWPDDPPFTPSPVQYCPEPLADGEPNECPMILRPPRPRDPSPTPELVQDSTPQIAQGDAVPDPAAQAAPAPDAPTPAARPRTCRFTDSPDLVDCPYRMRPDSDEQFRYIFRRHPANPHLGVVFISPEDPDSLTPRLRAAGANLEQICILNGASPRPNSAKHISYLAEKYPGEHIDVELIVNPLRLPQDANVIGQAIRLFPYTALVIIDPLQSVLPGAAQSGPGGLPAALASLAEVARDYNVAIIGICHLAKARQLQTLYRVQGSISLMGAARAAHLLSADPDQQDRRILLPLKTVYGKPPAPLAFRIVSPGRLEWETSQSTDVRRKAYLSSEVLNATPETLSAVAEACAWLETYLAGGPQPSRKIQRDALAAGISLRTLHRAKRLIAARSIELRGNAGWVWSTDPRPAQPPAITSACTAGSNSELGQGNGDGFPKAKCETA